MRTCNDKKILFYIWGGIGDFLLVMDRLETLANFLNKDQFILCVISHAKNIECMFEHLDYDKKFVYINNQSNYADVHNMLDSFQQSGEYELIKAESFFNSLDIKGSKYFTKDSKLVESVDTLCTSILKEAVDEKKSKNRIVAIHSFGSSFSNEYLTIHKNFPSKNIPSDRIKDIINYFDTNYDDIHIYILGLEHELKTLDLESNSIISLLPSQNIWDSFYVIKNSSLLIGADSAMKSFSCMLEIPSIVFLGDYPDHIRDEKFIFPYFEGVIYPIYFEPAISECEMQDCFLVAKTLLELDGAN